MASLTERAPYQVKYDPEGGTTPGIYLGQETREWGRAAVFLHRGGGNLLSIRAVNTSKFTLGPNNVVELEGLSSQRHAKLIGPGTKDYDAFNSMLEKENL